MLDWRHGIARALVLVAILVALAFFRPAKPEENRRREAARRHLTMVVLLVVAAAANVGMAGFTFYRCVRSHHIPLDQGESTWRAARLLWQGDNPYGGGAIVDYTDLHPSLPAAVAAGDPAHFDLQAALKRYDETLDPKLRQQILPVLEPATGGYKYGPVIILLASTFVPLGSPAIIVVLSSVACFALFWVVWRLLRTITTDFTLVALGLLALLLDRHISRNYLNGTATDVWPLLFDGLAILAYRACRPHATALALALAVGSKLFPSLLVVPLLLGFRRRGPIVTFAAAVAALYLPWLLWDPIGLIANALLWPALMGGDTTSWLHWVSPAAASVLRAILLAAIAMLWLRYLTGRESRLFWTLALANGLLLLAGAVFHNNYVPWCSIFVVLAVVEAFARTSDRLPRSDAAA